MHITYKNIIQERELSEEKFKARTQLLRNEAEELLRQYRAALFTPNERWYDGQREIPYANLASRNENGDYGNQSTQTLFLDDQNAISFFIATVTNIEIADGAWNYIPVKMQASHRAVTVIIDNSHQVEVPLGGGHNGYHEACKRLKESVIANLKSRFPD
ncbi:hypothetical protein [Kluyvera sichuanensis]